MHLKDSFNKNLFKCFLKDAAHGQVDVVCLQKNRHKQKPAHCLIHRHDLVFIEFVFSSQIVVYDLAIKGV